MPRDFLSLDFPDPRRGCARCGARLAEQYRLAVRTVEAIIHHHAGECPKWLPETLLRGEEAITVALTRASIPPTAPLLDALCDVLGAP
jgi:hypothetical protein